ncbi:MAG TPA: cytochrome c [Burkholderiaceae bacterium]|jgi:mono/diheme cytochrome c family protein|nr:cytochrome c [Burkholderiaceae bacterium]
MKTTRVASRALLVLAVSLLAQAALAQQRVDLGKREFDNNCAACHGRDGKGNGSITELLKRSPPDLTTMTKRNGGIFPVTRAYEVIEGAGGAHGSRDMPIWGQEYSQKAAEYYMDVPYNQEAYVRGRLLSLVEYLNRLQGK